MVVIRSLIALLLLTSAALAQSTGAASIPDPAQLTDYKNVSGCCGYELSGKTLSSQTINTGIRNLVIVADGQSNIGDNAGAAYTPTNGTKIDNLNIYDGAIYVATDPLLGSNFDQHSLGPANHLLRLADNLITANKFDRVIILIMAIGGSLVADHDTGLFATRYQAAFARLKAKGITPGLTNTTIIILWEQGETDCQIPTGQSAYAASLGNVIAKARAAGFTQGTVPYFVAQQTWVAGVTCAGIQAAQTGIVNHPTNIWAGPNSDSLNAANREAGNTHWNPTGAAAEAVLEASALAAFGPPF